MCPPKAVCIPKGHPFYLSAKRECLFLTLTMVLYRLIMAVKTPGDLRDPRQKVELMDSILSWD